MSQSRHVLLNNVDHKDLRIHTGHGERWGDAVMAAITFPTEFRNVQAYYPIVFQKRPDGSGFQALALFGFREGENLFLDGERWDAAYVPAAVLRQPFMIGFDGPTPVIHLDTANPRVGAAGGEPVFRPHGGSTEYLERMQDLLTGLHQGLQATPAFCAALESHQLLEPFALDIEHGDGTLERWSGFYTVNEERLAALDAAALAALHRDGHLEPAYMVLASMTKLRDLLDRAERRRACAS